MRNDSHGPDHTAPVRLAAGVLTLALAGLVAPTAVAQYPTGARLAHEFAAVDAAVTGRIAGLRLALLADAVESAAAGYDNAHVALAEDEAAADADRGVSVALVKLALPAARTDAAHAWWVGDGAGRRLAIVPPAEAEGPAKVTVRLATRPVLEFDVSLARGSAVIVSDARLQGAGGSATLSAQPDVVELEWRQGRGVHWASLLVGMQPQGGVAAKLVASIGL